MKNQSRKKDKGPVEAANFLDILAFRDAFTSGVVWEFTPKNLDNRYVITLESASSLSSADFAECFNLIASTSQADYERSSIGWHPAKKKKEMRLPDLKYLLVRSDSISSPAAFASFMMTYEDGLEVVYVYEIHLSNGVRGSGLGRHLMAIIEVAGERAGMSKAMLTVFASNLAATGFYARLNYERDPYSPEARHLRNGVLKEPDYLILSKRFTEG